MIVIVKIKRKKPEEKTELGNPIIQVKDNEGNQYTVADIVEIIDQKFDKVYAQNQENESKKIEVETCTREGKKYIRTKSDNTTNDNLENLPTF